MDTARSPIKVLVTGASGKTGVLVVQQLLKSPDEFEVCVAVRSDKAHKLMLDLGITPDNIFHIDINGSTESLASLKVALHGCHALIICTSAVPEVKVLPTVLGGLWTWLASSLGSWFSTQKQQPIGESGQAAAAGVANGIASSGDSANKDIPFVPVATWKGGQTPEQVDYQGQVAQIEAAKASGTVQHVVLISSAGGCDPHHFLNHIGAGDILNWKRLAEQHLISSGLTYTILHPNHLVDLPAGRHEVVLAVDDALQRPHWRRRLKMPRCDLAALAVQALLLREQGAANRSVDCAAQLAAAGAHPTTTTEQFKELFHGMPNNCDYSINDRTQPNPEWACQTSGKSTCAV